MKNDRKNAPSRNKGIRLSPIQVARDPGDTRSKTVDPNGKAKPGTLR
jgi:hypothetical protein